MGVIASKKQKYDLPSEESPSEEIIETMVCGENDLYDGEMKIFQIGQSSILLIKQGNKYSALGSKCTHYGAPLVNGVLKDGRIRCPWHGACFDATTGDIEDFPGLDSLPCFEVVTTGGEVKVRAKKSELEVTKRVLPLSRQLATVPDTFVVVGGGAAGQACLETLRQNGFMGKLILISKENALPYDRPKLSKALDATAKTLQLRKDQYYKDADIMLVLHTSVTGIDTKEHSIVCDNGKLTVKYDSVMLATGGSPIGMQVPGCDLKNVCLLRTPEDGNYIAKCAEGKAVVVLGTSFIGMEVASSLLSTAKSVNIIGRSEVPFKNIFGTVIGSRIKAMLEEKGVVFYLNNGITRFLGKEGTLIGIELQSNDTIQADICVIGIGVHPSTKFLADSNIQMGSSQNFVQVNEYLETNVKGVYAGGDIVEFPLSLYGEPKANVCHWQMALKHGQTAALNMLGKKVSVKSVPFFWSVMCGKSFRYAGYAKNFDDVVIEGDVEGLQFSAYYLKKNNVVALCSIGTDPMVAAYASDVFYSGLVTKKEFMENISKVPSLSKFLSKRKDSSRKSPSKSKELRSPSK